MDRYSQEMSRSSSVEGINAVKYKRRNYITGQKVIDDQDRKIGAKKLMEELSERKDRGLGEGHSLYLERRYNQQKN